MRKILLLNYEFPPLGGGASPVSYEIAKRLSETGNFSIDVVTMGYKDLPKYEEVNAQFRIHRVACLRSKKEICHPWEQATYLVTGYLKARELLKKQVYDVCHTHFIIPTGLIAYCLKKKHGLKYVLTAHGSDVPGYNPDRFVFLHKFTKGLIQRIVANAECVTTPSLYLEELIKKNIGNYKTLVLPNSSKDYFEETPKEKIILSSGRLLPRKGFQYLIEAFKSVKNEGWELFIAGDGPSRQELESLARDNKNIIFTGWLDNKGAEYKKLLNRASIFSLLSTNESQGIVYIEGMSASCAILASNITACQETVSPEVGILVSPQNLQDIRNALERLMGDQVVLKEYMKKARLRYIEKYDFNHIITQYADLFRSV